MDQEKISAALRDISSDPDPSRKAAKLASLCASVFRERGYDLVVVGGSAIELLTEGAYVSGDLDLCLLSPPNISLRERQELMGLMQGRGGPRSWEVGGMFVDLLGVVETLARTPMRQIEGPYGLFRVMQPEELLVERVLVSVYPQPYAPARACAKALAAAGLRGDLQIDWAEVRRLAALPQYHILKECQDLLREVANELQTKNPCDTP